MKDQHEYQDVIELLKRYDHAYYVEGRPLVSDLAYDKLYDDLCAWEKAHPDQVQADSPSVRVGSDLSSEFPEVSHRIPMLSLDKAYSMVEISAWARRCATTLNDSIQVCAEEKIDGLSVVLEYQDGILTQALTRGNGLVGNEITANIRTIRDIPLRLSRPIHGTFRGEVYLSRPDFTRLNQEMEIPYANPRNLAGGTLRRIKSSEVAKVPLRMFVYEGFYPGSPQKHQDILSDMEDLGFRVNKRRGFFAIPEELPALEAWMEGETQERPGLDYEIDGLVLKVNDLDSREELGYTGHHPRWALAYKFESPQASTRVLRIDVQVGRTGRITPVARVEPVVVGGATIQNITLHNQDYIQALELGLGDQVSISRRGDVIPAVETVLEKAEDAGPVWQMPDQCPSCASTLVLDGAHHFCTNFDCPDRARGRLGFFVGRDQMDIEGLGPETVEVLIREGLVQDIPDLYTFDPWKLLGTQGFGEKKIEQLIRGLAESKTRPFLQVLPSLGLPDIGPKVTELLLDAGLRSIDQIFALIDDSRVESLLAVKGLGEKKLAALVAELSNPRLRAMVQQLKEVGLQFEQAADSHAVSDLEQIFAGQSWCVTGSFASFKPRDLAMDEVKKRGGRVLGDVSGALTHLLAGEKAGSKLAKAEKIGTIRIVTEADFLEMISAPDASPQGS